MSWACVCIYREEGEPWEELVDDLNEAATYLTERKSTKLVAVEYDADGKETGVVMTYRTERPHQ